MPTWYGRRTVPKTHLALETLSGSTSTASRGWPDLGVGADRVRRPQPSRLPMLPVTPMESSRRRIRFALGDSAVRKPLRSPGSCHVGLVVQDSARFCQLTR